VAFLAQYIGLMILGHRLGYLRMKRMLLCDISVACKALHGFDFFLMRKIIGNEILVTIGAKEASVGRQLQYFFVNG